MSYFFSEKIHIKNKKKIKMLSAAVVSSIRGSCKKFCHWVQVTSVLRFIKHIFITNLQSIPPLLKHIFVTFLPSCKKQINSLLLVSVEDTDK